MELAFAAFVVLVTVGGFLFVMVQVVRAIARSGHQKAMDDASPTLTAPAQVATKRIETYGDPVRTAHYATFEFASGERREFRMKGEEYGLLAEGDRGELTYQGSRYRGFARTAAPASFAR